MRCAGGEKTELGLGFGRKGLQRMRQRRGVSRKRGGELAKKGPKRREKRLGLCHGLTAHKAHFIWSSSHRITLVGRCV